MANDKQTNFDYYFATPERAALFVGDLMHIMMIDYYFNEASRNIDEVYKDLDIVLNFNPEGFYSTPILEWMNREKDNEPKYIYTRYGKFENKDNDKDDDNNESNL